jgi:hypothetical protein
MKVAQYEVLGMMKKDTSVPLGTIETLGFWSRIPLSDCQPSLFRSANAHLVVGLDNHGEIISSRPGGERTTSPRAR